MLAGEPFTVAVIGRDAGAEMVVWKFTRVGTCRQIPESDCRETAMEMLSVLEALPERVAVTLAEEQAFGASREPVIVWTPFLNVSCKITAGTLFSSGGIFVAISRVCGTDRTKAMKTTNAMMPAEVQRRLVFMNQ